MLNLIGAPDASGAPVIQASARHSLSPACTRIYGKVAVRPGRKMGHVTLPLRRPMQPSSVKDLRDHISQSAH